MQLKYLLFYLLLFAQVVNCYYSSAQVINLKFNHLNADNGLPMGNCAYGITDSRGYIWFRAENSLVRYNGFESKIYTLKLDSLISQTGFLKSGGNMLEDKNGNIWFNAINAIGCYNRIADSVSFFSLPFQDGGINWSSPDIIRWINDSIFIGKQGDNNFQFNINSCKSLALNQKVFNALRYNLRKDDSKISIILNDNQHGFRVAFYDAKDSSASIHNYFKTDSNSGLDLAVNFSKVESDSVIWFTSQSFLFRFNVVYNSFEKFSPFAYKNITLNSLEIFQGYIFIGSDSGLFVFDKSKKKFINHSVHSESDPFSISVNIIEPLYIDSSGNIICETNFRGIDIANFYKSKFKYVLNKSDAIKFNTDAFVRCMVEDDVGNTWLGTMNGGVVLMNKENEVVHVFKCNEKNSATIPSNGIEYMMKDHLGRIWIITPNGLAYFDADKKITRVQIKTDANNYFNKFNYLIETRSHRFLATKYGQGIFEMRETKSGFLFDTICTNCGIRYLNLYEDKLGRIWMGDDETITLLSLSQNSTYFFDKKIRINAITKCFVEDADGKNIWITTSDGLIKMNMQNFTSVKYTTADGLPDNYIYGLVNDHKGNFWLSTNRGLSKFTQDAHRGSFRNYTIADGLQGNEFNSYSFLKKTNGEIWFGGINGINIISADTYNESKAKPHIHISNMLVNDEPVNFDSMPDNKEQFQFSYDNNTFSFNFSATDLRDANNCKLQYMLKGVDDKWLSASNPGFARYTNLHEGNYNFSIRASNSDGIWSNETRNISIAILPPWYRTWWFFLLSAFALTGTAYLFFFFRIKQIKDRDNLKIQTIIETQNIERKRISTELHDDLGSGLSTIRFLSEIAMTQAKDVNAKNQMVKISVLSNDLVDNIRQIVWTMNSEQNSLENLIQFIKKYANDYLETNNIELQLNIQEDFTERILTGDIRRNIFLVVKECLHNVVKHAQATVVDLKIEANQKMKIILHDNGKGIEKQNQNTFGNGLNNMRKRMEACNGTFEIENKNGTTVTLEF